MEEFNIKRISLRSLKPNPNNPRSISERKFGKLMNSLLTLPKMLEQLRPIAVSAGNVIAGGNMRWRALKEIAKLTPETLHTRLAKLKDFNRRPPEEQQRITSYWLEFIAKPTVPVVDASTLDDDELRQFIIADNGDFGQWDFDMLANEWEADDLANWGVDVWQDVQPTAEPAKNDDRKVTITYDPADEQSLAALLGLQSIDKKKYSLDDLLANG